MVDGNLNGYASYQGGSLSGIAASRGEAMERTRRMLLMRMRAAANGGGRPLGPSERVPRVWEAGRSGSSTTVVGYPVAADRAPFAAGIGGGEEDIVVGVPAAEEEEEEEVVERVNPVPVIGAIAVSGRLRYMEDAICIKTKLCSPAINGFLPVHYFGAFDGHGGPHFSLLCKQKMHEILKEELTGDATGPLLPWSRHPAAGPPPGVIADESVLQETWRQVMTSCFSRTETAAFHTCPCGCIGFRCGYDWTPETFSGTTAVTVVLTENHVVTANCGDSRAVLYRRGGIIVPLSFDHKATRRDEIVRIEAAGGRILLSDTHRVEGILAMTRAIGDEYLKPLVISEPEVTFNRRSVDDEFIVLASDGLWDVMSTLVVGNVTRECLKEPRDVIVDARRVSEVQEDEGGPMTVSPSRSASAAALLCRLALARNSGDNISVVVIDMERARSGNPNDGAAVTIEL